ncbi:hypothetical protein TNIN_399761 [Trichonephila inaurata madagascariensis]|uniref:Uncharacterized protein n=1 Tax=Trichonephila inaurata madagascariensis TaxID=2747483 RepID=A0A8X7C3D4_9ARAC|nr:hypothetical protein TNIN_399761 [Trichonephila inaurata madagascariensis]
MNGMIAFICIAALFSAMVDAGAILPYRYAYGAYKGYYTPLGAAPYAVAAPVAAAVAAPYAAAAPYAVAAPVAAAVAAPYAAAPAVPAAPVAAAVVPEYAYPYYGAYGVLPYIKK